jgi:heme/copper-type cytochrome/quinol oxidase subunit 1
MEMIGVALGLIGLAVGLIPLALEEHISAPLRQSLMYTAIALLIVGFALGFSPLRGPLRRLWQKKFGPFPLMMIYIWASRIGLAGDGGKTIAFFQNLLAAAVQGKMELYGQLVTDDGLEKKLTKIPNAHLETHAINVTTALLFDGGGNEQVCTYDPKLVFERPSKTGCYYNLHVNKAALKVVLELAIGPKPPGVEEPTF